jgi:hypothetical protein
VTRDVQWDRPPGLLGMAPRAAKAHESPAALSAVFPTTCDGLSTLWDFAPARNDLNENGGGSRRRVKAVVDSGFGEAVTLFWPGTVDGTMSGMSR